MNFRFLMQLPYTIYRELALKRQTLKCKFDKPLTLIPHFIAAFHSGDFHLARAT